MADDLKEGGTTDKVTEAAQVDSSYDVSDEDFLKMAPPPVAVAEEQPAEKEAEPEADPADQEEETELAKDDADESEDKATDENPTGEDDSADGEPAGDIQKDGVADSDNDKAGTDKDKVPAKKVDKEADADDAPESNQPVNYEAEYKKVMAPFKANGKTIQLDSVDDVVSLMQMGANYTQKMRALKPHLKIVKMLDNNSLLDESKVNFLIDLSNKNPEAITKLIKDSGIDPLNVDVEKDSKYKPNDHTVGDNEVELQSILSDVKATDTGKQTLDVISNKWDEPSKRVILENPEVIRTINDHISTGVYDEIVSIVEKERVLGRLNGVSDLLAYQQVGDHMQKNNMFKAQKEAIAKAAAKAPETKPEADPKLKKQKLAAGGSRSTPSGGGKKIDFNPLDVPDEEFEKLSANDFI